MATASSLMTTEELLAIPEDGTDRWLIAGELGNDRRREGIASTVVRWPE